MRGSGATRSDIHQWAIHICQSYKCIINAYETLDVIPAKKGHCSHVADVVGLFSSGLRRTWHIDIARARLRRLPAGSGSRGKIYRLPPHLLALEDFDGYWGDGSAVHAGEHRQLQRNGLHARGAGKHPGAGARTAIRSAGRRGCVAQHASRCAGVDAAAGRGGVGDGAGAGGGGGLGWAGLVGDCTLRANERSDAADGRGQFWPAARGG